MNKTKNKALLKKNEEEKANHKICQFWFADKP